MKSSPERKDQCFLFVCFLFFNILKKDLKESLTIHCAVLSRQSCLTLCDLLGVFGAHRAPLSMGFSRQEFWRGLPSPSLGYNPLVTNSSQGFKVTLESWSHAGGTNFESGMLV